MIARPLVRSMEVYVTQLEREVHRRLGTDADGYLGQSEVRWRD